jgi:hypothetical protein
VRQVLQRALHRFHLGHALFEVGHVRERDAFHVGAGAAAVLPQLEQLGDLGHAEAEVAGAADEAQRVDLALAVLAVAGLGAPDLRQEAQRFVVADHLGRHAGACGGLADVESFAGVEDGTHWTTFVLRTPV